MEGLRLGCGALPFLSAGSRATPASFSPYAPGLPPRSLSRVALKKAGPYLVPCGPIFGAIAIAIAERSALGDHTFSKGPHSRRDRFAGFQVASHYSQVFENLGGVSILFHDRILVRSRDGFHRGMTLKGKKSFIHQFPAERLVMTAEPLLPKAAKPKPERAKPKQPSEQPTLF
jgi:hypothetical protein